MQFQEYIDHPCVDDYTPSEDQSNNCGETPLWIAAENGHTETAQLLIDNRSRCKSG